MSVVLRDHAHRTTKPMPTTCRLLAPSRSALIVGALLSYFADVSSRADPLRELRSIRSSNGVLQADLVIKAANVLLNGHMVHDLRTFNGDFPGPTLRTHPGDVMKIRYI